MPGVSICRDERSARLRRPPPGLGRIAPFWIAETKDEQGTGAWDDNGIVQQALRALKRSEAAKKLVLIGDVCLCEYTSHGHCGVVSSRAMAPMRASKWTTTPRWSCWRARR